MRSKARRGPVEAAALVVAALTAAALVAGCTRENSSQADPTNPQPSGTISVPPGSPSPLPVAATAEPTEGQQVKVELNDVRADARGLAVLRLTLTNEGAEPFPIQELADEERDPVVGFDAFSCRQAPSGITLVDPEGEMRYHPLLRDDGDSRYCMNTRWGTMEAEPAVDPGDHLVLFTTYVLPSDVRSVTVEVPGYEPVEDMSVDRE